MAAMPPRRIALGSLLMLVLSGCPGGAVESAPTTPSAPITPSGTATPTASAMASGSAASSSSGPAVGEAPDQHAFPELEATLPDQIAGVQTDRYSFAGQALGDGGMIDDLFIGWASKADRSPDELRVGVAVPAPEAGLGVFVAVMELPGLSGEELAAGGLADIGEQSYEVREVAGRRVAIGPAFAVFWVEGRLFMAVDVSGLGDGGTGEQQTPSLLEQAIAAIP